LTRISGTITVSIMMILALPAIACPADAGEGWITGTVYESGGRLMGTLIPGDPIDGATVQATGSPHSTTTNSTGRYNITVPDGNITLQVSATGFNTKTSGTIIVKDNNTTAGQNFILEKPSGNLTGTVLDADDGKPISLAIISFPTGGIISPSAITNGSGVFVVAGLPVGALGMNLTVLPPYNSFNFTAQIRAGQNTTMNFLLRASSYVSVLVKDISGNPVPNATLVLGNYSGTADASGQVFIDIRPGAYEMAISAPGFLTVTQPVNISKGELAQFEATLTKAPAGTSGGTAAPFGGLLVALLVVAVGIAAAGALCFLLMRKGRKGPQAPLRPPQAMQQPQGAPPGPPTGPFPGAPPPPNPK